MEGLHGQMRSQSLGLVSVQWSLVQKIVQLGASRLEIGLNFIFLKILIIKSTLASKLRTFK